MQRERTCVRTKYTVRTHEGNIRYEPLARGLRLPRPEPAHLGARCQQLVKRALCLDLPILEHDDAVGTLQHGSPVRDDEAGGPLAREEPLPHLALGLHI